ncbi:histidine phosphatase family protein [Paenibacillus sp. GSMTC-2017]|uniref:histidine phosphatase family protein n=1 Tax=Paenibacillus sp. GSMTC-2017 TaxID=2794350 RepID=UPI0018DA010B|nr:histidine phosphatase family protein [Paenibacillus sp. GSMTC-2017]MBH5318828.1 histidine phosphatase family protein [Paenibacillus sp. GSMTC-2017]
MIYVVRHGQTDLNKEGRLQGRQGLPLNESGIEQAELLKEEFKSITFNYVFSSPQERAIQTAELATGIKAIVEHRLDVFDLGEADGLKREEVKLAGVVPDSSVYKGVEEIPTFMQRVFAFMKELEDKYDSSNVTILLSGHRCTTGCIGAYFEGIPEDGNLLKLSLDNGKFKGYTFNSVQVHE